jgi:hypothetical protein
MGKRPDWSRPLPQPLQILDENDKPIITLKTFSDVRKMLLGLPEPFQLKTTWGHVGVMLDEVARGGDIMDVVVPLCMVLGMEGIACRPREPRAGKARACRQTPGAAFYHRPMRSPRRFPPPKGLSVPLRVAYLGLWAGLVLF